MNTELPSPNGQYGDFCTLVAYNADHNYEAFNLPPSHSIKSTFCNYSWKPTILVHNLTLNVWFSVIPATGSIFEYVPNPIAEEVAKNTEPLKWVGYYGNSVKIKMD